MQFQDTFLIRKITQKLLNALGIGILDLQDAFSKTIYFKMILDSHACAGNNRDVMAPSPHFLQ